MLLMKPLKNNFLFVLSIAFILNTTCQAQIFMTRTAHVNVHSANKLKSIDADNYQVVSSINFETGDIKFEGLLKSFEFKLGALDRVFNSERINVNQYPKFRFEGKLEGFQNIKPDKAGEYTVKVKGTLYLWDEKRITSAVGKVRSDGNGKLYADSDFVMRIEEQSMVKLNELIDQKLPDIVNLSTDTFGVDRDIKINLDAVYTRRQW